MSRYAVPVAHEHKTLTNGAFGYPRGARRRFEPIALLCIHVTANPNTLGLEGPVLERNYANRAGSNGPSAHDYVGREGRVIQAVNERAYAAWSNGKIDHPNTDLTGVRLVLRFMRDHGANANEAFVREVECCGTPSGAPITDAQLRRVAQLVAVDARRTGLPIDRKRILTHADLDSVNRRSCAFTAATREERLEYLIDRARAYYAGLLA